MWRMIGDDYEAAMGARPEADVLLAEARQERDALRDELESLRGQAAYAESLDTENQRLRAEAAEAQRDALATVLEEAFEWMGYNPPTTGWGLLDHGEDKNKRDIIARGDAAIANARG